VLGEFGFLFIHACAVGVFYDLLDLEGGWEGGCVFFASWGGWCACSEDECGDGV
jgi:hypothetical protein